MDILHFAKNHCIFQTFTILIEAQSGMKRRRVEDWILDQQAVGCIDVGFNFDIQFGIESQRGKSVDCTDFDFSFDVWFEFEIFNR